MRRTSLQQHADGAWVISECGVVQRCAATETGPAAEPAAELILSGYKDCEERTEGRGWWDEKNYNITDKSSSSTQKRSMGTFSDITLFVNYQIQIL